jgi:hypothetical protein
MDNNFTNFCTISSHYGIFESQSLIRVNFGILQRHYFSSVSHEKRELILD